MTKIKDAEFTGVDKVNEGDKNERSADRRFWARTVIFLVTLLCCTAMEIWAGGAEYAWLLLFVIVMSFD